MGERVFIDVQYAQGHDGEPRCKALAMPVAPVHPGDPWKNGRELWGYWAELPERRADLLSFMTDMWPAHEWETYTIDGEETLVCIFTECDC